MFIALIVVHVITSIVLVLVVLLQSGRGAELGAAFGGIGQSTFGRGQYTFIAKVTTALAAIFMVTSLALSLIAGEGPGRQSLLAPESAAVPAPAPVAPAATPTPAPAAPALPQTAAPARGK
jgi:preprotein translocase subunit SecG